MVNLMFGAEVEVGIEIWAISLAVKLLSCCLLFGQAVTIATNGTVSV